MIVNLTPHAITYIHSDGNQTILPSVGIARASQQITEAGMSGEFRIVEMQFGEPVGLPDYAPGTQYVVSAITVAAAKAYGRTTDDLLLVADTVRNEAGQIIGCRAFARA